MSLYPTPEESGFYGHMDKIRINLANLRLSMYLLIHLCRDLPYLNNFENKNHVQTNFSENLIPGMYGRYSKANNGC